MTPNYGGKMEFLMTEGFLVISIDNRRVVENRI